LLELARIQPNAAALLAAINGHSLELAPFQRRATPRTIHRGCTCSLGLLGDLHLLAQLFDGLFVFSVKIFFFQPSTPFIKRIRHLLATFLFLK
jgi:hypothetical protein